MQEVYAALQETVSEQEIALVEMGCQLSLYVDIDKCGHAYMQCGMCEAAWLYTITCIHDLLQDTQVQCRTHHVCVPVHMPFTCVCISSVCNCACVCVCV